jgi:hypothetical protein
MQSSKLFLQSSELELPQPLTRRRVCPPSPPQILGEGAHSLAREGLGDTQFRLGDINCGTLYIYVLCGIYLLTQQKRHLLFVGEKCIVLNFSYVLSF